VLSLCKLKTLEYRVFRKMREKFKNYLSNKGTKGQEEVLTVFKKEVHKLLSEAGVEALPNDLQYYAAIF